ncbi:acyltransferase family protein [Micromonospora sp. WMMD1102]|uniref:acyltransferase family protein n=1 Tax=Micromonospora sp. WMMD1102 TaxID=3016105 RepID=UPI0024156438|nr:acyltransferase family protein [Micromonospora sp. WMMD1102]MDG4785946.1 acyltransferase family protein [Micromonospora sp. WMMD1102]
MKTRPRPRPLSGTAAVRPSGQRADLAGLRALAVGSLLLGTTGIGIVPGGFVGVDVFLVVSGFLVTAALLGDRRRIGRVDLVGFLARRVRHALPAGTLVLAASLPLALACLPRERWSAAGWDVLVGAGQLLNWRLAAQDAQATVPDADSSLLAHLWAVGVAAQFVLVWALLVAGVTALAIRRRRPLDSGPLLLVAGLLGVGSFAWSVWYTTAEPGRAFLVTTTRFWEPAVGAALALLGTRLAGLPRWLGAPLGWAGLAAVLAAVLTLRPGPEFPGFLALLPVLGTAAIIAGGATGGPATAGGSGPAGRPATVRPGALGRLLGAAPLRAAGAVSHPLYLWYWPLLVAAHARFGELRPVAEVGVLGGAVLLAVLTHRYVEIPARTGVPNHWPPGQVLRIGTLLPAVGVVAGLLFQLTVWPPAQPPGAASGAVLPAPAPSASSGAAALGRSPATSRAGVPVDRVPSIDPKPAEARADLPDAYPHGCFPPATSAEARACLYGDRTSSFTVALVGDTHAADWVPALQAVAAAKRWRLVTYLKANCPFLRLEVSTRSEAQRNACAGWYHNVHATLTGPERPQLLLTTSSRYRPWVDGRALTGQSAHDALVRAMRRTWSELASARVLTVVLRDTPMLPADNPRCVAANPDRLTRCAPQRRPALSASAGEAQLAALDELPEVGLIDLTGAVCPATRCAPVIGGVLVYRDNQHLTATYAATLAPRLRTALDRIVASSSP